MSIFCVVTRRQTNCVAHQWWLSQQVPGVFRYLVVMTACDIRDFDLRWLWHGYGSIVRRLSLGKTRISRSVLLAHRFLRISWAIDNSLGGMRPFWWQSIGEGDVSIERWCILLIDIDARCSNCPHYNRLQHIHILRLSSGIYQFVKHAVRASWEYLPGLL